MILIYMIIFIGCSKTGAKKDYPAAIMVNDTLYYSTGEERAGEVDESAVIGRITSYTDEMPTKNGEANFNRDLDSEYAFTDEGLVVCIDNKWILFERIPTQSRYLSDELVGLCTCCHVKIIAYI